MQDLETSCASFLSAHEHLSHCSCRNLWSIIRTHQDSLDIGNTNGIADLKLKSCSSLLRKTSGLVRGSVSGMLTTGCGEQTQSSAALSFHEVVAVLTLPDGGRLTV